jgi:hypothetical protein
MTMSATPIDSFTEILAGKVGMWDVTETIVSAPGTRGPKISSTSRRYDYRVLVLAEGCADPDIHAFLPTDQDLPKQGSVVGLSDLQAALTM